MNLFTRGRSTETAGMANRARARAQAVNQGQAAQAAGRGKRSGISAKPSSTRTKPSRTF
jgi:hypothetical protein